MGYIKERFIPIILFACIGLSLVAIGYANHQGQTHTYSYDYRSDQSVNRTPAESPLSQSEKTPSAKKSISQEEWQRRDHKAQIGMHRASIAAVTLTVLGLGLVGWTLFYTKEAARSAAETLKVTAFASELELQPYIQVSQITLIEPVDKINIHKGGACVIHGNVDLTNTGKTPIYIRNVIGNGRVSFSGIAVEAAIIERSKSPQFKHIPPSGSDRITIFLTFVVKDVGERKNFDFNEVGFDHSITIEYDDLFSIKKKEVKSIYARHYGRFKPAEGGEFSVPLSETVAFIPDEDVHPSKRNKT